ncbi:hypothetical protein AB0B25_25835 [Nocardia sp. NPDC049190]
MIDDVLRSRSANHGAVPVEVRLVRRWSVDLVLISSCLCYS